MNRQDQHFGIHETILTDGSKVYKVVGYDGDRKTITFRCTTESAAKQLHKMLNYNKFVVGMSIDVTP